MDFGVWMRKDGTDATKGATHMHFKASHSRTMSFRIIYESNEQRFQSIWAPAFGFIFLSENRLCDTRRIPWNLNNVRDTHCVCPGCNEFKPYHGIFRPWEKTFLQSGTHEIPPSSYECKHEHWTHKCHTKDHQENIIMQNLFPEALFSHLLHQFFHPLFLFDFISNIFPIVRLYLWRRNEEKRYFSVLNSSKHFIVYFINFMKLRWY